MRLLNPREVQYLVTRQALSRFPGACQVTTRERSRLGDVIAAMITAITGTGTASQAARETIARILGITSTEANDLLSVAEQLSIETLREGANTVTLFELTQAKADLLNRFGDVPPDQHKPDFRTAGIAVLGIALIMRNKGDSDHEIGNSE